jgi:hypothetical protein
MRMPRIMVGQMKVAVVAAALSRAVAGLLRNRASPPGVHSLRNRRTISGG